MHIVEPHRTMTTTTVDESLEAALKAACMSSAFTRVFWTSAGCKCHSSVRSSANEQICKQIDYAQFAKAGANDLFAFDSFAVGWTREARSLVGRKAPDPCGLFS